MWATVEYLQSVSFLGRFRETPRCCKFDKNFSHNARSTTFLLVISIL
jgi:hypothetical protein